jgi:muramoyltetrapeptide carboxypeptidase LdcA involved in peptidoglycan recycling
MSGNKIIKSVSFNVTNSEDKKMLEHLKRRNFSGYVKKLIMGEIESKTETETTKKEPKIAEVFNEEKKLTAAERLEQLKKERNSAPERITLKVDGMKQEF